MAMDAGPLWDTVIGVVLTCALLGLGWVLKQMMAVAIAVSSLTLQVGELGKDDAALARRLETLEQWRQSVALHPQLRPDTGGRSDERPTR